ncbi:unnamed protein product [Tetraodon nigroviridis]|uniref:(spotted green pufferfish) hypothetical protein n=1 Tax=Tetraodon nigroviridis TaxID=99883 RepID=Q4SZW9_TETNG|nr:unnamed protein product [Tetraodon nigroviridis]
MRRTSGVTLSLFDISIQSFKISHTMADIYRDTRWCCVLETRTRTPSSLKRASQRRWSRCLPENWCTITSRVMASTCTVMTPSRSRTPSTTLCRELCSTFSTDRLGSFISAQLSGLSMVVRI